MSGRVEASRSSSAESTAGNGAQQGSGLTKSLTQRLSLHTSLGRKTGKLVKSQPQINSSIPTTGLLNYASQSTNFSTAPGFGSLQSTHLNSRLLKADGSGGAGNNTSSSSSNVNDQLPGGGEAVWTDLSSRILPLFNGEGLRGTIEDLNELVRQSMKTLILNDLLEKLMELMKNGVQVFSNKLQGIPDEKIGSRLMEIWSFFFGTVLPYFQGVFIPLQVELKSIAQQDNEVSIRTILLMSYRNHLIIPLAERIIDSFQKTMTDPEEARRSPDTIPRMLQMLTILSEIKDEQNNLMLIALQKLKDDMKRYGRAPHSARSEDKLC